MNNKGRWKKCQCEDEKKIPECEEPCKLKGEKEDKQTNR